MAGNWKMNLNHVEAVGLVQKLTWTCWRTRSTTRKSPRWSCCRRSPICGPQTLVDGDRLEIGYGAQDVSAFDNGAYTGDISADMLVKLGCRYVVVGHSERRRFHGEDDNIVNAKTLKAVSRGMVPIVCVGERLAVREQFRHVPDTLHHVEGALVPDSPRSRLRTWSSRTSRSGRSEPRPRPRTPRKCARRSAAGSGSGMAAKSPTDQDPLRRIGQCQERCRPDGSA